MSDPNVFPNIALFPRLQRVRDFVAELVRFMPAEAPDFMSNHYRPPEPIDTSAEAQVWAALQDCEEALRIRGEIDFHL